MPWRVYRPADRGRRLAAPARWTRSTAPTTSSRLIQRLDALPSWVPLVAPELGSTEHRPGRLRRRGDGPPRARPGARRPGVPPRQPAPAARRRRAERVRARRPRAADGDQRRQAADRLLPKGALSLLHEAARRSRTCAARCSPTSGSRTRSSTTSALVPRFDGRDTQRALTGTGIEVPELETYARSCGTTGSATSTPTCTGTARSRAPSTARRCSSPARRAASAARRRSRSRAPAGSRCSSRARRTSSRRCATRSRRSAAPRTSTPPTSRDPDSIEQLVAQILSDHPRSTCSSTTPAARSAARSRSAYDRFHDFERTIQLNYLGTIKLILAAAPAHARAQTRPHRERLLDRRADEPAALLAPTSPRSRRSTRSRASSARRRSATASRSRRSTCRSCARR